MAEWEPLLRGSSALVRLTATRRIVLEQSTYGKELSPENDKDNNQAAFVGQIASFEGKNQGLVGQTFYRCNIKSVGCKLYQNVFTSCRLTSRIQSNSWNPGFRVLRRVWASEESNSPQRGLKIKQKSSMSRD